MKDYYSYQYRYTQYVQEMKAISDTSRRTIDKKNTCMIIPVVVNIYYHYKNMLWYPRFLLLNIPRHMCDCVMMLWI